MAAVALPLPTIASVKFNASMIAISWTMCWSEVPFPRQRFAELTTAGYIYKQLLSAIYLMLPELTWPPAYGLETRPYGAV
jgi:hypothetical protein